MRSVRPGVHANNNNSVGSGTKPIAQLRDLACPLANLTNNQLQLGASLTRPSWFQ